LAKHTAAQPDKCFAKRGFTLAEKLDFGFAFGWRNARANPGGPLGGATLALTQEGLWVAQRFQRCVHTPTTPNGFSRWGGDAACSRISQQPV